MILSRNIFLTWYWLITLLTRLDLKEIQDLHVFGVTFVRVTAGTPYGLRPFVLMCSFRDVRGRS